MLWNKITAVIEERKKNKMDDAYKAKDDAIKASQDLALQMIKEEKRFSGKRAINN